MTTSPLQPSSSRIARSARPARAHALRTVLLAPLVSVSLVLAACAGGTDTASSVGAAAAEAPAPSIGPAPAPDAADEAQTEVLAKGGDEVEQLLSGTSLPDEAADGTAPGGPSSIARQIEFIGNGAGLPQDQATGPAPISIDLPTLGVEDAPVNSVGVEANGDMQIPGASDVGWYRFGPRPGDTGSAVLAAHIAFNGEDGVFRDLADMDPGDRFSVSFEDGASREFVVIGLRQYSKTDIPLEEFFSRDGTPRLVLITCGGRFNRALQSYDDNVVVISIPVDLGETRS